MRLPAETAAELIGFPGFRVALQDEDGSVGGAERLGDFTMGRQFEE